MASDNTKDLTQTIGDCGKFQVFLTLAVHSTTLVAVWGMMFMTYGVYNPGWICVNRTVENNVTGNYFNSKSHWFEKENLNSTQWTLNCDIKRECQYLVYNDESSTVVTQWDLSCDLAWVPSMMISIQMTGSLIGSYLGGQVGDKFGRKVSLYLNLAFNGISHVLAIFSVSWRMHAAVIFFIGLSAAGILTNSYPYPLEFTKVWWRGVIGALPFWNISLVLFVFVVFVLRDWQRVHIVSAVMCTLVFLTIFWTPESVRWLAVSGKVEKAKNVVTKISRMNKRSCPDTSIIDDIAKEENARMGGHTYTYVDLFRTPVLRGYSIKFGIIWITIGYAYFGISFGIKALSGNFYINLLISSLLEIPGLLCVASLVNKLGRRICALIFFAIEVCCCIALVIMFLRTSGNLKDMSVLVLALFCKTIVAGVLGVFNVYSAELYPTVVRTIQAGYLVSISNLGSIVSPYLIPNDPDKLYIAFITLGIFGTLDFILVWTLPETKERIMMDTTENTNLKDRVLLDTDDCSEDKEVP